jgi:hypothetical protein
MAQQPIHFGECDAKIFLLAKMCLCQVRRLYYVAYVFNYVVLDISIIPPRPTRLITLITMEGH